ncbi:uncharacterized protein BO66DRAFT_465924 [Aspergillus aculeatinus CBS 121060]|uniref:Uncharacterized protein n=1 Tax=Aspergillus aculeatinus CBS 121060 TaxID=1448322 RepID=A0ACD1GR47_9EURO|nr:hypothetical protein BO66DRAFT_465924 [Aspergillus aculeatinus CBS 121060]RAH63881.1 hypothetical protein BO66DRAFT_465924 [Aspergillus aculeatinus CBS 121060]
MSSLSSEQMAGDAVSILDEAAPDLVCGAASIPDADCGVDRKAKVEDDYEDDHEENQDGDLNDEPNDGPDDQDHCDEQIDQPTDAPDAQTDAQPDNHNDEQPDESTDQTETTDTQPDAQKSDENDDPPNEPATGPHDDDNFLHEAEAWRTYIQQEWLAHGGLLRWTTHRVLPAAGALAQSALLSTPALYILHLLHLTSYLTGSSPAGSAAWPLRFRFRFTDQLTELEWTGALLCVLGVWHQYLFTAIFQSHRTTRARAARYLDVLGLVSCLFCMPGLNGWAVGQMYGLTFAVLHLLLLGSLGLYDSAVGARGWARRGLGLREEVVVNFVDGGDNDGRDADVVVLAFDGDDDDDDDDAVHELAALLGLYCLP